MNNIEYSWNEEKTIKEGRRNNQTIEIRIKNDSVSKERINEILTLPKLERLEIINCNIQIIPNGINKLKNLKLLNFEGNNIRNIPDNLTELTKLESLNLSRNNIKRLPNQLSKLQNLTGLNLFKNQDLIVNEKIFELEKLEVLNLGLTNVENIVDNISNFSHLKNLDLSGTNIEQIPMALFSLNKLEKLSLESNQIKEIPDDIENLKALQTVDLRFNNIDKISKKIFDLNLSELLLENNPFLSIKELQNTNVEDMLNRLFQFHDNEFKKIDLSNLGIDYIPTLSQFKYIEILDLSNNKIQDISNDIFELLKLKELNLSSNNIKTISNDLLNLKLEKLDLNNNDVSQIKGFSLNKSPKEIIEFLLFNQQQDLVHLNEAKLLIVGDENAGKTSLVERMVYDKFESEYKSTKGIDILNYEISSDIKVNIWDFAGQEITYQVHNLFMSEESLYLLVIDGQKENSINENFDWLETIASNAPYAPIIVVVTKHESNRTYRLEEKLYNEKFPNIKEFFYVSSKDNIGFCELKEKILLHISKFSNKKIPSTYIPIKKYIEDEVREEKGKENKYMLSAEGFDDICEKYNVTEQKNNLRTILNDIGTLIGFNNDKMHVVNPSKMIDKIYEIIRSKDIDSRGELPLKNEKDRYYNWVIEFLIKNKIALKIDESKVLIPSRLPVNRPNGFVINNYTRVNENNEIPKYGLNFRYKYRRGFKKSILFDFILQMQQYIDTFEFVDDSKKYETKYWEGGVFLKYEKVKGVVLSSKVDKTITIHIPTRDEKSQELLSILKNEFEKINKNNRDIRKEVAVVKDGQLIRYKSYKFLKNKNKNDNVEIDVDEKPYTFSVRELLDGYERTYIKNNEEENNILKPLIITEGKTDWKHLKKALERFQQQGIYTDLNIQFEEYEEINMGDAELDRMVKTYCKTTQSKRHIFMFDRDNSKYVQKYGVEEFNNHENNVYSFCIPAISTELDEICIEFYYKKDDIKTEDEFGRRIFLGDEFKGQGNPDSKCGKYITGKRNAKPLDIIDRDKKVFSKNDIKQANNIALSKNEFTNNIIDDVEGFDNFDIEHFKLIFDVIEKIVND